MVDLTPFELEARVRSKIVSPVTQKRLMEGCGRAPCCSAILLEVKAPVRLFFWRRVTRRHVGW